MVYFQTKNPDLGKFLRALEKVVIGILWPFGIYYLRPFGIFYGQLVNLWQFSTFYPSLVNCDKKNQATLVMYLNILDGLRHRDPLHGGLSPELLVLLALLDNLARHLKK
jgi:hypothetical protein